MLVKPALPLLVQVIAAARLAAMQLLLTFLPSE
jgi:hypothetical protein